MKDFTDNRKVQRLLNRFPSMLNANKEKHVLVFRRLIERAMKYGYWNGSMAAVS